MINKINLLTILIIIFLLTACRTYVPNQPLLNHEARSELEKYERVHPQEKIYRQYVKGDFYFQFERIDKNKVIYGWYTCTNCSWTREKIAAIYDGSYLYVIYGHHESFFLNEDSPLQRLHPGKTHWSWSTIEKFQVEGRNLVKLMQYRKCSAMDNDFKFIDWWSNEPWSGNGDYDCRLKFTGTYNDIWVSTIDETLVGKKSSSVDTSGEDIESKLLKLKRLYKKGIIDKKTYERKKKEIIDSI